MPEIPLVAVTLEARELLGDGAADVMRDPWRFCFGAEPSAVTPDTPDIEDDVRASLDTDWEHRFIALAFTCSFRPDDEPFVESRLLIRLSSQRPGEEIDPPTARSVQPERLMAPIERQTGRRFGARITAAPGVGVEGFGGTSQDKYDVQEYYLVGSGKRSPTAEWYFRKTKAVPLEGMHDLRLIAQVRRGVPALAEVMMTAKIRRRAAGVVPYRAVLPEQLGRIALPS